MDKGQNITKILEKIETELQQEFEPKIISPNQTNPQKGSIYKKLAMFRNSKIGDKFSIRDLFR